MIAGLFISTPVLAIDWSSVPGKEITLFYPGQTGLEWILDKTQHDGAARFSKRGKPCQECHKGEEVDYGNRFSRGEAWESAPLTGRRGSVKVSVKAAADASNIYFRLEWPDEPSVAGNKLDKDFQTKITLMLGDDATKEYVQGGCWAVCHQDARRMPKATKAEEEGLKKYLSDSRKEIEKKVGGGENYKSDSELTALMKSGNYLEFWQARLNPGAPAKAVSGYILKERTENSSTNLQVTAEQNGNNWIVEFSRPLQGSDDSQKTISSDKTYTFGIALHDQYTIGRYHLVSFEYTMKLGGGADLEVKKF